MTRGVSGLERHARTRVLVDENGTESGGVDAQIPVTASVDASGYENVSRLDPPPPLFLGRVFRVRFQLLAGGCRFGSGLGRSWGFVARGLWSALPVLFLFCGVSLDEARN